MEFLFTTKTKMVMDNIRALHFCNCDNLEQSNDLQIVGVFGQVCRVMIMVILFMTKDTTIVIILNLL